MGLVCDNLLCFPLLCRVGIIQILVVLRGLGAVGSLACLSWLGCLTCLHRVCLCLR